MDEALALPTEEAAKIALRTQQVIAYESGVANTVDPLGGSYFVESLTNEVESAAYEYFSEIDSRGGMIASIESGFPQREIQEAAYQYQKAIEENRQIIVGVNEFASEEEVPIEILQIGEEIRDHQIACLEQVRRERSEKGVSRALTDLKQAAQTDRNLMPLMMQAVREYATLGEISSCLKDVFGIYEEPGF
jgi:methylmalonyl-CoA mutase N-terminal domain/subunit